MTTPPLKTRTHYTQRCDARVPRISPQSYLSRPKTPNGNHEYTDLHKTFLDTRDSTNNELAYTRAQITLLATTQAAREYNAIMAQTPTHRRVDIRPTPIGFRSQLAVPDPDKRENGIYRTPYDDDTAANEERLLQYSHGGAQTNYGSSSIIVHNPFVYTEQKCQPDHVQLHHIANTPLNPQGLATAAAGLGHELGHAQHSASGATPSDDSLLEDMITTFEHLNGFVENKVRAEFLLNKRKAYIQPIDNQTGLDFNAQENEPSLRFY